jgi:hypothetical protein
MGSTQNVLSHGLMAAEMAGVFRRIERKKREAEREAAAHG